MRPADQERRAEPRRRASGEVSFLIEEPVPRRFAGQLVDVSHSGFRATHRLAELQPGTELAYRYTGSSGRARVMWTTIISERVQSGFLKF